LTKVTSENHSNVANWAIGLIFRVFQLKLYMKIIVGSIFYKFSPPKIALGGEGVKSTLSFVKGASLSFPTMISIPFYILLF